jgi:hypothetical protein
MRRRSSAQYLLRGPFALISGSFGAADSEAADHADDPTPTAAPAPTGPPPSPRRPRRQRTTSGVCSASAICRLGPSSVMAVARPSYPTRPTWLAVGVRAGPEIARDREFGAHHLRLPPDTYEMIVINTSGEDDTSYEISPTWA